MACKEVNIYKCKNNSYDDPSAVNINERSPITWDAADTLIGLDEENKPARIQKPDFTGDVYTREETDALLAQKPDEADIDAAMETVNERIEGIDALIPETATPKNKLTTEDFVNSSIEATAARPLTYDAAGNPFPTKALLDSSTTFYNKGIAVTPTENDYVVVQADETQAGGQVRYGYDGTTWVFRYKINDAPFTTEQNAAINSGVTQKLVEKFNEYPEQIESGDAETLQSANSYADGKIRIATTNDPVQESIDNPGVMIVYIYESYSKMYYRGLPVSSDGNDLVPIMYSNNLPAPFEVTASSVGGNPAFSGPAFNAFKKNTNPNSYQWTSANNTYIDGVGSEWIQIKLDVPRVVTSLIINKGYQSRAPVSIVLEGSNDNTEFNTVYTTNNIPYTTNGSTYNTNVFARLSFSNTISYRYYRLTTTLISVNDKSVSIGNITLIGY